MQTSPRPPNRERDLRDLLEQIQAGILLCEEILDEEQPGWHLRKRGRRGGAAPSAARNAWGLLNIAWVNLGHMLIRDHGVESWSIPPLAARSEEDGETTLLQFGRGGTLDVSAEVGMHLLERRTAPEAVRLIEGPREPLYTLEEARRVLEVCQQHVWKVETGDNGSPTGVRCATPGCDERRRGGSPPVL